MRLCDSKCYGQTIRMDRGVGGLMTAATIEERLARVETTLEHVATKADVANLKAWMIGLLGAVLLNGIGVVFLDVGLFAT